MVRPISGTTQLIEQTYDLAAAKAASRNKWSNTINAFASVGLVLCNFAMGLDNRPLASEFKQENSQTMSAERMNKAKPSCAVIESPQLGTRLARWFGPELIFPRARDAQLDNCPTLKL